MTKVSTCDFHYERGGKCNDVARHINPFGDDVDPINLCDQHFAVKQTEYVIWRKAVDADQAQQQHDPVNHPTHYRSDATCTSCGAGIECIDVVRHMDFDTGNAIKYLWRAGKKDDIVQDLKKAVWYLQDRIAFLEGRKNPNVHALKMPPLSDEELAELRVKFTDAVVKPILLSDGPKCKCGKIGLGAAHVSFDDGEDVHAVNNCYRPVRIKRTSDSSSMKVGHKFVAGEIVSTLCEVCSLTEPQHV